MTLVFSLVIILSSFISLFLVALKSIKPSYHSHFMTMKYFCKKSVLHSFLGFSSNTATNNFPMAMDSPSKCGLGLIASETPRVNPNVIESSSVLKPTTPPPTPRLPLPLPPTKKKDPGGIGFIDDIGGGLMSCTESLGIESCDERRVDDDDHDAENDYQKMGICEGKREVMLTSRDAWRRKRSEEKRERMNKKFPPPLSSLNQHGQPCFYLKPVRRNGRLELTEVRIQRPEILRPVRQNGRLRLHLVSSDNGFSEINVEKKEEEIEETKQEDHEQQQQQQQQQLELHLQDEEDQEEVKLHEKEEEKKVEELWRYRVNGEGFRRCHELVMSHRHDYNNHHDYHHYHHHHHHLPNVNDHHSLHVWRQPCVITR